MVGNQEPVPNSQQNTPSGADLDQELERDAAELEKTREAERFKPYLKQSEATVDDTVEEETPENKDEELKQKKLAELEEESEDKHEDSEEKEDKSKEEDPDDHQGRINALWKKNREAQKQLRQYQAEIDRLKAGKEPEHTPEEIQAKIDDGVRNAIEQYDWNQKVNNIISDGRKEFGAAFNGSIAQFRSMFQNEYVPTPVIEAMIETGAPGKLINYLSSNPDKADELFSMKPMSMISNLHKLAEKLTKPVEKQLSKAPPPPTKRVNTSNAKVQLDDLDEWMRKEDEKYYKRGY